ncbi:hypothetical protein [Granulicella sp. S190]|uniref:cupin domain-containing protein n=1 Tax=Granulicella sp. S190 TaxID=1747226 RepID=UPI00131BB868|nr:hypothetical protein [Granulicella sp. S190]
MRWLVRCTKVLVSGVLVTSVGWSQAVTPGAAPQVVVGPVELLTSKDMTAQGAEQLEKAKTSAAGSSSTVLAKYPGHYTMMSARTKSGGAEVHANYSDFLIVLDGDGTELTGGTVVDPKQGMNGETRGLRLEGATAHTLHKGDILHIPAGTPHQAIEVPGQTITIFVIKAEQPAGGSNTEGK